MSVYLLYPFRLLGRVWRQSIWPLKTLYVAIILFAILSLSLPTILKVGIEKALLNQGIQQVELAGVQVDLLEGKISIEHLNLTTQDGQPLKLGGLVVDLSWSSLLDKQLKLELVELNQTQLSIILEPNQWIEIAGIRIPLDEDEESPAAVEEEIPSLAFSWGLGLDALVLNDTEVTLKTPEFERTVIFKKVRLTELYNWQGSQSARLQFEISLLQQLTDSAALLQGDLKVRPFSDIQTASGTLKLEQLALQNQQALLPKELGALTGNWVSSITFNLSNDHGKVYVENTAGITLSDFALIQPQQKVALSQLQWIGNSIIEFEDGHLKATLDAVLTLDGLDANQKDKKETALDLKVAQIKMRFKQDLSNEMLKDVSTLLVNFDNELTVRNLDVSLPTQTLRLEQLKFDAKGQATIKDQQTTTVVMQKQPDLTPLKALTKDVNNHLTLKTDSKLSINGVRFIQTLENEGFLQAKIAQLNLITKQDVNAAKLQSSPNLQINFDNDFSLQTLEVKAPKQSFNLAKLKLDAKGQAHLKDEQLSLHLQNQAGYQNLLALLQGINSHLNLTSDANLSLAGLNMSQTEDNSAPMQATVSELTMTLKQTLVGEVLKDSPNLQVDFVHGVKVQNLAMSLPKQTLSLEKVALGAQGQAKLNAGALDLQMQNQQSLQNLTAFAEGLTSHLGAQSWLGSLSLKNKDIQSLEMAQQMQVATQGDLGFEGLVVNEDAQDLKVLGIKRFSTHIKLAEDKALSLQKTKISDLLFAQSKTFKQPLLQLKELLVTDVNLSAQQDVRIDSVVLTGLNVDALLTSNKKIAQLEPVIALGVLNPPKEELTKSPDDLPVGSATLEKTEDALKTQAKTVESVKPVFAIQKFSISPDSQVKLVTQTTQPQMETVVNVKRFEVGALNSLKPNAKTPLDVDLGVNQYTQASFKGYLAPLGEKVNAQLDVKINDLDLYTFSPLIQKDLGLKIQSGGLNMDNTIQIEDSILDSQNKLKLIGFKLVRDTTAPEVPQTQSKDSKTPQNLEDGQESSSVTGALSNVTFSLALDLLRDGDNNIKLDVPIKGDLSDPKFNPSQVIQVALQNTIMSGSKALLIMTLQPYGAIFMASKYAFDKATGIYLENVKAEIGSSKLLPEMDDYLNKISILLTKQPQVTLKVCGYYTPQDRAALVAKKVPETELIPQLFQLAKSRQDSVKDKLVNKGVTSNRLTLCQPEARDEENPGVSLSI